MRAPDGARILVSKGGSQQIWLVDPDGGDPVKLTSSGSNEFGTWSRNGAKIAYVRYAGGAQDLWVMSADGSAKTQLTVGLKVHDFPTWGP